METIILIAIFIAPGMICRTLRDSFSKERRSYSNHYDYLTQVIVDSVAVNIATITLINECFEEVLSVAVLSAYLNEFANCLTYIAAASIFSVAWAAVKNIWIAKAYTQAKNKLLRERHTEHSIHTTDWDTMLNEEEIAGTWQVMSIYKDDKYIMSGMRHSSSTTNAAEFEIRLDRVKLVERLLRREPEMFKIKYVYYNVSTGLRVVMYDQKVFEEHWGKIN